MNIMKHSSEPEQNFIEIHEQNTRIRENLVSIKSPLQAHDYGLYNQSLAEKEDPSTIMQRIRSTIDPPSTSILEEY